MSRFNFIHILNGEKCIQSFGRQTLKERDCWEDLDVDGRIILTWILKKYHECMDWIYVAYDMDQWRAFVNTVTCIRVP
jgi:hypothetical protein